MASSTSSAISRCFSLALLLLLLPLACSVPAAARPRDTANEMPTESAARKEEAIVVHQADGGKRITSDKDYMFHGFDPSNGNDNSSSEDAPPRRSMMTSVSQCDVDLLYLWTRYERLDAGSKEKVEVRREIVETAQHIKLLDVHIEIIGQLIFGAEHGPSIIKDVRPTGQPVLDDWDCLSSMIRVFQSHCGLLFHCGGKQVTAFVNICNRGISEGTMEEACIGACQAYNPMIWKPVID